MKIKDYHARSVFIIHNETLAEDIIGKILKDEKDVILHLWINVEIRFDEFKKIWPLLVHVEITEDESINELSLYTSRALLMFAEYLHKFVRQRLSFFSAELSEIEF